MTSPAPLNPLASDGRPGTLSADAGGAKMHVRQTHAGRAASGRVSHAKSAQAVTLFTMGRSARSGRGPVPANRRATPMVVGARARRPFPIRWWQNLAAAKVALKDVGKSRTRLSNSGPCISVRFRGLILPPDAGTVRGFSSRLTSTGGMKARHLSHTVHRTPRASDGIGRGLSGFLLPLLACARQLFVPRAQPAA